MVCHAAEEGVFSRHGNAECRIMRSGANAIRKIRTGSKSGEKMSRIEKALYNLLIYWQKCLSRMVERMLCTSIRKGVHSVPCIDLAA